MKSEPPTPEAALSPTQPTISTKGDNLEALRSAIVAAAGISTGLWLSYVFVLFYLLVALGGVTHRELFFESPVKLPFLNIDLPLKGFFWLGPALFLVVPSYVLVHFVMFADKVGVFDSQLQAQIEAPESGALRRLQLPLNIFVQMLAGPCYVRRGVLGRLLELIAWISLVIGPVALLVFFQLQFLPYHNEWIAWWQRFMVLIDLTLLWCLWPAVMRGASIARAWRSARWSTVIGMAIVSLISAPLVFAIATFPGEWLEETLPPVRLIPTTRAAWTLPSVQAIQTAGSGWVTLHELLVAGEVDFVARKPKSLWSNRLVLPSFDAIDHTKFDSEAKIAAASETVSLRGRHLEGAVLIGAELRKADFAAAYLERADLTTADVRDANFACTGWVNSPSGLGVRVAPNACTHLQGAKLAGAQLQGADLKVAELQGADLTAAQLQGADLGGAQLQGAVLTFAELQGADLLGAQLQGADLRGAQLPVASLRITQLQGADLSANLQGADLDGAQLQGADLRYANLQGASLDEVFIWRADAPSTDARNARINRVISEPKRLCGAGPNGLLGCDWSDVWWRDFKKSIEQKLPDDELRAKALKRLDPRLDPTEPLKDEAEIVQRWAELQSLSPTQSAYEGELLDQWRRIGCSANGAPYVLEALIQRLRLSSHSPLSARLAAEFLKEDCAGVRGLSVDMKEKLKVLAATADK